MSSPKEKLKSLPLKPGVYLFKDKNGTVLYIGKAKSLRKRVSSYFNKKSDIKTSVLLERLHNIDYVVTASELDALLLEDDLVKKYKPRYNISLKDDKAYPYLKLTVKEEWPRLFLARRKKKDGAFYFGPYQGGMVRAVIRLVKKMFSIRWCKESPMRMRQQACLYYRIGNCAGPCVGKIRREDYMALVQGIILLLEGKMEDALAKLKQEMQKASRDRDFERAAYLRDRIKLLEKMLEGKELGRAPAPRILSAVTALKKELKLKGSPMRVEAFDVSNIQGTNIVGSMVVFFGGLPLKQEYRRFRVKTVRQKANDVAAIYEIIKRRYAGSLAKKLDVPDLILIDGGGAQLSAGLKALKEAGLKETSVISLAKREEEICLPKRAKPLKLSKSSSALQLLQRIRDEAHRFAVSYHRLKREKGLYY